jgi:TPR repeat protein
MNILNFFSKYTLCFLILFQTLLGYEENLDEIKKQVAKKDPYWTAVYGQILFEGEYNCKIDRTKGTELISSLGSSADPYGEFLARLYLGQNLKLTNDGLSSAIDIADSGNPRYQYMISMLYKHGIMVKVDRKKSVKYLEMASRKRVGVATAALATCYQQGSGVKQNLDTAINLYTQAANNGHAKSRYNTAFLIRSLYPEREEEYLDLYKKAAKQNHPGAINNLGVFYYDKKEFKNAFNAFIQGARLIEPPSFYSIGRMHERGEFVEKSLVRAAFFYKMSSIIFESRMIDERQKKQAETDFKRLEKTLSESELESMKLFGEVFMQNVNSKSTNLFPE